MIKEYQHKNTLAKVIGGNTIGLYYKGGLKFHNSLGKNWGEVVEAQLQTFSIICHFHKHYLTRPITQEGLFHTLNNCFLSRKLNFKKSITKAEEDHLDFKFTIQYYSPFGINDTLLLEAQQDFKLLQQSYTTIDFKPKPKTPPKPFSFNDILP